LPTAPQPWHGEFSIVTRSGEPRLMLWNSSVLYSGTGDVIGTASIGEDVTEKRQAETRLKRLNRVYAVLSGINSLIVRVREREELFRAACQIAIEHGRFKMAWIGIVDRDANTIVPVASAVAQPDFPSLAGEHAPFHQRHAAAGRQQGSARGTGEKTRHHQHHRWRYHCGSIEGAHGRAAFSRWRRCRCRLPARLSEC
jgi:PAS domain-containing protein